LKGLHLKGSGEGIPDSQ